MSRKTIVEYDILRVIVTLFVLLGHCTGFTAGINYAVLAQPALSPFSVLTVRIRNFIYLFHMPLYIALSGALFRYTVAQRGYPPYRRLLARKAKKLLIPFFAVTLLYAVPIKYASGCFAGSQNLVRDVFFEHILLEGNNYLWFLAALFCVFLLFYPLERYAPLRWRVKLPLLCLLLLASNHTSVHLLQYVLRGLFWFSVGYCFEMKRASVCRSLAGSRVYLHILLGCAAALAFKALLRIGLPALAQQPLKTLQTAALCYTVYAASCLLARTPLPDSAAFRTLRANTFGLYLYSDPLNYALLVILWRCCGPWLLASNAGAALLYAARFFLNSAIALAISMALRRHGARYLA